MKLENGGNGDSFSNSEPMLATDSMNDFHSNSFKHILTNQMLLISTNGKTCLFDSHKLITN